MTTANDMERAYKNGLRAGRKEAREDALRLIEAPIPGLRALVPTLKDPKLVEAHIKALTEAATAVRESGEFVDALREKKDQPSDSSKGAK